MKVHLHDGFVGQLSPTVKAELSFVYGSSNRLKMSILGFDANTGVTKLILMDQVDELVTLEISTDTGKFSARSDRSPTDLPLITYSFE